MKFRYKEVALGVFRPIIRVAIKNPKDTGRHIECHALIDSGADMNLFSSDIAEAIGLDLESGKKGTVSGITAGESQATYTIPVILSVGGWEYRVDMSFMKTLSRNGHGLLGQKGFFDLFHSITFDYPKQEVIIKAITA
ncbi:MAG: retropepsin-like aspartic protease [Patescibacteria group bacterium]